ncbi:hypothetical protein [Streptomyces sp. NBC_01116]|uniref:imine reductase family protein n=1 Tax=Streptomyces sp. NBC_01116 TaxID=2903752 RepID=UPI00352D2F9C
MGTWRLAARGRTCERGAGRSEGDGRHDGRPRRCDVSGAPVLGAVHASEAHGIDASVMRAAEGLTRRAIGLGHGGDELTRLSEVMGRHL